MALCGLISPSAIADGPGLGNVAFAPTELLSTVARFESTNGASHGHGSVAMHKGYLMVPFSLDGGGLDESGFAFYDVSNARAVQLTFTTEGNPAYATGSANDPGDLGEPHGYPSRASAAETMSASPRTSTRRMPPACRSGISRKWTCPRRRRSARSACRA